MTISKTIQAARENLGIDDGEAADFVGIPIRHYTDLEWHDDELEMTLSLAEVSRLCGLLRLTPRGLLGLEAPCRHISPAELREYVLADWQRRSWTAEEFGDHVGWDVRGLIDDPDAYVFGLNLDGLKDICSHLGLNYVEAIPDPIEDQSQAKPLTPDNG